MMTAEALLLLGEVWTLVGDEPAEAVLLQGGAIVAVGKADELRARSGAARVERFARITPGLQDAHVHPAALGRAAAELDLRGLTDPRAVADRVRERAMQIPPGQWISGGGFLFDQPPPPLLDEAAPRHPVFLQCRDLHSAWVNQGALERAALGPSTEDPEGGKVLRDARGRPTGVLLEQATELVQRLLPALNRDDWLRGVEMLARRGYTAAHAMAYGPLDALRWAEELAQSETLPLRLYWSVRPDEIDAVSPGWRGRQLDVAAVKLFADGALGSQTAWMREPYADGRTGLAADSPTRIREVGERALRAGFTLAVHAIGDQAVTSVAEVFRDLAPLAPRPLRIEHAQHVPDDVLELLTEPLAVSMQPLHLPGDVPLIRKLLPGREREAFRFADLVATGIPVAFGSDAPVVPADAEAAMQVATDHCLRRDQSLSRQQALIAFTRDAARAAGWDDCGTIEPGKRADLTLWDERGIAGRVFEGRLEPGRPPSSAAPQP